MLGVVILLSATAVQFLGAARERTRLTAPDFSSWLPSKIPGWEVEDRPVAETPEMKKAITSLLNYDSAILRIYRKGDTQITVYISYWLPGKMPENTIDAHTPDICWVYSGWAIKKQPPLPDQKVGSRVVPVPNVRLFTMKGEDISVTYWDIVGSRLRNNKSILEPSLNFWQKVDRRLHQVIDSVLKPPQQQLFIRVSSNKQISEQIETVPAKACIKLASEALAGKLFYFTAK